VRTLCRALRVSPSGYYAWRSRPESTRAAANRQLLDDVRCLHARHHGRYGSPRMHAALRAEGRGVSRGRIERLMRRHGIRATAARRYRLADITYVPTGEGWLYLAAVLDLATRKVVGWAMRDHLRTELATAALLMAIQR
jgi:putative transposase